MMTNFFGINVTENIGNVKIDGDVFATNSISAEQQMELEQALKTDEDLNYKSAHLRQLRSMKLICLIIWIMAFIGLLSERSFAKGYRNAPFFNLMGLMCFIVWLSLFRVGKTRKNEAEKAAAEYHIEKGEALWHNVEQSFGIPKDADRIDVFVEYYSVKNGKLKRKSYFEPGEFLNLPMYAFAREGNLCFANMQQLWEIPLSSFRSITMDEKMTILPYWNKSEPIHSEKYKPYKIRRNKLGQNFVRYYRVEIVDSKGEFYLLIPEYDGEIFMRLTDLRVNDP